MESGEEGKAARLPPPRPSQGPSRGRSHPSRSYILSSLLRRFPSNILFPSAPPVQKVEVGRVAAAGGGRGKLPPAAGRLAFQLSN